MLAILDRDGVINKDLPTGCRSVEEFEFLPGVCDAIVELKRAGVSVAIATNQAIVGRGEISMDDLSNIHSYMLKGISQNDGTIDRIYYCTDTKILPNRRRKPAPGMLLEAMKDFNKSPGETFFIGDSYTDVQAALGAGCHPVLLKTGKGRETIDKIKSEGIVCPETEEAFSDDSFDLLIFDDLYAAVKGILE